MLFTKMNEVVLRIHHHGCLKIVSADMSEQKENPPVSRFAG
jgi:hypothetical protein